MNCKKTSSYSSTLVLDVVTPLPFYTLMPCSAISRPSIASTVFRVPFGERKRQSSKRYAGDRAGEREERDVPSERRAVTVPSG